MISLVKPKKEPRRRFWGDRPRSSTTLLRIEICYNVVKVEIDGYIYGESGRKIENIHDLSDPANVVASGYVKFKARVEDSSIADNLYYKWTTTAGTLVAPTEGTGSSFLEVKWDAPNGHEQDVTLSLEVKESASGPTICTKDVKLKTIRPYVVRVKFVDDFWDEEQDIHDSPDAEYNAIDEPDNPAYPVCYVMGRGMQVQVDLAGAPDSETKNHLTKKTPIKVTCKLNTGGIYPPVTSFDFTEDSIDANTEDWSVPDYSDVEIESTENIFDMVAALYWTFEMNWTFKVKNSSGQWITAYEENGDYSQLTDHRRTVDGDTYGLYLIYDVTRVPDDEFTRKHIDYACRAAHAESEPNEIAGGVGPDATGGEHFGGKSIFTAPSDPDYLASEWDVVDSDEKADCGTLATLMRSSLLLLGVNGSEVRFVYSRHAAWEGLWKSSPPYGSYNETHPTLPGVYLGMWFASGSGQGWNNYEGACYFNGSWWMGGMGEAKGSAYDVLIHVTEPNQSGAENSHQCWNNAHHTAVAYPPGNPLTQ